MSKSLACAECGHEGYDNEVAMTLVEFPEEQRRLVPVLIHPTELDKGEQATPIEVPERYAREPRCRDKDACAKRVAAFTHQPSPPVTEDTEEDQIWR